MTTARRSARGWGRLGALAILLAGPAAVGAPPTTATSTGPTDLARYVPQDVLMAYWGRLPGGDQGDDHVVMRMLKWVDLARQLNLIPRQYRTISDIAGSLPVLGKHDHVVMLLDVSSRKVGEEGYRLDKLKMAVVVATGGDHKPVVDRIRRVLAAYTDKRFAKIEIIPRGDSRSYRLTDERLPVWATWEWGALGSCYVIGLGQGAFDDVAKVYAGAGKSIGQDPWFADARRRCRGRSAMIEWLVDYQDIRRKLEAVVKGRPEAVLKALGAGELERGLATLRMDERYLVCYIMHQFKDENQFVALSDPQRLPKGPLSAVPEEASCAIMQLDLADWVCRFRDAYLASQTEAERDLWYKWFAEQERERGFHARSQLLERLGDHLIVHNWPTHPLQLPLTFTLMLEIDDPGPVQDAIDAMMAAWQDWQRRPLTKSAATRPGTTTQRTRDRFRFKIGREPDGMWYIQAGVVRPAIAVSDRYIVISWSPEAVRENLRRLKLLGPKPSPATTPSR